MFFHNEYKVDYLFYFLRTKTAYLQETAYYSTGIGNLDTSPNSTRNIKIARLYVESDRG